MPLINLSNSKIFTENILGMLGLEPGATGWEASMLSTVICGPPAYVLTCFRVVALSGGSHMDGPDGHRWSDVLLEKPEHQQVDDQG